MAENKGVRKRAAQAHSGSKRNVALGSFDTSGTVIPVSFKVKGGTLPNGTILVRFLEDNHQNGSVADQTSFSESLVVDGPHSTATPEPAYCFFSDRAYSPWAELYSAA